MRGKKGVFYTLSLTLFSLLLFGIAVLFLMSSTYTDSRLVELSFSERIYEADTSIGGVFMEAFFQNSDTEINVSNGSVIIEDHLQQSFGKTDSVFTQLQSQVENDFPVQVNLNQYKKTHGLIFEPVNISYEHNGSSGLFIAPNNAITKYSVHLVVSQNISSCVADLVPGGEQDFFLSTSGSGTCSASGNGLQKATVTMNVGGTPLVVYFEEGQGFSIAGSVEANTTVEIDYTGQISSVASPVILQFSEPSISFSKQDDARIAISSVT